MSVMKRWHVEVSYKSDRKTLVKRIEEIAELHDLIEHGPDWREIDQIVVTLIASANTLWQCSRVHGPTSLQSCLAARALKLIILCAARLIEVLDASWSEIDPVRAVWTIPATRRGSALERRRVMMEAWAITKI